jgi:hypothetical protein
MCLSQLDQSSGEVRWEGQCTGAFHTLEATAGSEKEEGPGAPPEGLVLPGDAGVCPTKPAIPCALKPDRHRQLTPGS